MQRSYLVGGVLWVLLAAGPVRAEEVSGLSATVAAVRMPMRTLERHLGQGTIEARGLPAVILKTRLAFHRAMGRGQDPAVLALQRALNAPVTTTMTRTESPVVPVYARQAAARQRPGSEAAVVDLTTSLVTRLRQAPSSQVRLAQLKGATAAFDRRAFGRLLWAHRKSSGKGDPIVFATDAFKPQPRNGGGVAVASGGPDVYLVMQRPQQLLKQGKVGFAVRGGQPGTLNMGPTAGSQIYFEVDRKGKVVKTDVVGRGDLLLMSLSSQLATDIAAVRRTGSKADPQDLLALVNHVAPTLLRQMVQRPKPAVLFKPMPEWVPFTQD
jgi:hypothetical protein